MSKNNLKIYLAAMAAGSLAAVMMIGGFFVHNVLADPAALSVDYIDQTKAYAIADNTFTNGWQWNFYVTAPDNEIFLRLKFNDLVKGADLILAANNVRFYSAQSSNAAGVDSAITLTAANTYGGVMRLSPNLDLVPNQDGRQIKITVEIRVPLNSAGGSYSTSFGFQTNPLDFTPPVITLNGANPQTIELGAAYIELGATALDDLNGSVAVITDASQVNINTAGAYSVTYSATDIAGNTATTARAVKVVDTISPTAVVSYDITAPTNGSVIATIIPSEPVIGNLSHAFTANGSFTFTFTDLSGNPGSAVATVNNITPAPVILSSIEITVYPIKNLYHIGEPLDLTGLVVVGHYSDGHSAPITITTNNVTGFEGAQPPWITLTITCEGQTAVFSMLLNP